jgi:hypothetical protein
VVVDLSPVLYPWFFEARAQATSVQWPSAQLRRWNAAASPRD